MKTARRSKYAAYDAKTPTFRKRSQFSMEECTFSLQDPNAAADLADEVRALWSSVDSEPAFARYQ
jgi:hypothetical protein